MKMTRSSSLLAWTAIIGLSFGSACTKDEPIAEETIEPEVLAEPAEPAEPELAENLFDPTGIVVYFDTNSSDLSSESQQILDALIQNLKNDSGLTLTIEGHADERGSDDYNQGLGDSRSTSVKDYLVSNGIEGSQLNTISYGEQRPLDNNSNEEAWSQNRRVVFTLNSH